MRNEKLAKDRDGFAPHFASIDHPDFGYHAGLGFAGRHTFVFNRDRRKPATMQAVEEWRANDVIVRAHGGRMLVQEHELGEPTKEFDAHDCRAMKLAVLAALPMCEIADSWNGVGCWTYSVSVKVKP